MKILNVVVSPYRACFEEQDDTVLWLTQSLRKAGAEVDVLLDGAAVNYAISNAPPPPLSIGGRAQRHAPDPHGQVRALIDTGATVYAVKEEIDRRGIQDSQVMKGITILPRSALIDEVPSYEQLWHW